MLKPMETVTRKTLLYRSAVEYADFSLNHVVGCSHGCRYPCYAFLMKKRSGTVKTYEEWCSPRLVSNALDLLEKEIPKYKRSIKYVHLCFATDPFMYRQQEVSDLSLRIIRRLNADSIPCTILTKGLLPPEIADDALMEKNEYGITLVSLSDRFNKYYEPNAAGCDERLRALRKLHDRGLRTWVSIEPYPPPALLEQDIGSLLDKLSFVNRIVFGRLNYNAVASNCREDYCRIAATISGFCEERGIGCHIKKGTLA